MYLSRKVTAVVAIAIVAGVPLSFVAASAGSNSPSAGVGASAGAGIPASTPASTGTTTP